MRSVLVVLAILVAVPAHADPINAVLGDASWSGDPELAPEVPRIRAHLRLVHRLLATRDVSALSPTQRAHRAAALAHLVAYTERGEFPRRTGDAFPGRRPRFIDDRGVHCAVGQLIADSGDEPLAREIADRFEYAYVPAITVPALAVWAESHGFTVHELAMIQPQYGPPPTRRGAESRMQAGLPTVTLACAQLGAPPAKVAIHVVGAADATITVTTKQTDPFSTCFVQVLGAVAHDGSAWSGRAEVFAFDQTVSPPPVEPLFEQVFGEIERGGQCIPRPGAIPKRATYTVKNEKNAFAVTVATQPSNKDVEACLGTEAQDQLVRIWPAAPAFTLQRTKPVASKLAIGGVPRLPDLARGAGAACFKTGKPPAELTVSIAAKVDAKAFAITTSAKDPKFVACFKAKLDELVKHDIAVWREDPNGGGAWYTRIDAPVKASATIQVTADAPIDNPLDMPIE